MILGVASKWEVRKGLEVFISLAEDLPEDFEIFLVGISNNISPLLPKRIRIIEKTNNIGELRELYSIADVLVNPTMQDNFPTVNLEAVSCGTPVITYRTGGSPENSYTPTCVVEKGDYQSLKELLLNCKFEKALNPVERYRIGKECMIEKYLKI